MQYAILLVMLMGISPAVQCMEEDIPLFNGKIEVVTQPLSDQKNNYYAEEKNSVQQQKQDMQKVLHEEKEKSHSKKKDKHKPAFSLMGGISPDDLGKLAPVALVMYCFNEHPKLTMVTLAGLLLAVLCQSESTKSRLARFRLIVSHRWHYFKGHILYMFSRTRF